jgi:hypothetical protein
VVSFLRLTYFFLLLVICLTYFGVLYKWGGVGLSEGGTGDTDASRWHIYTRSIPFGRDNEQEPSHAMPSFTKHSAWLYTFATLIILKPVSNTFVATHCVQY